MGWVAAAVGVPRLVSAPVLALTEYPETVFDPRLAT